MNSGIYYQALTSLYLENANYNYPRALKEILRKGEITNVVEFQELLAEEIASLPLSDSRVTGYFWFISEIALTFALWREDFEQFNKIQLSIDSRVGSAEFSADSEVQNESWKNYFKFLALAGRRLKRHATVENFDNTIDELEWSEIDKSLIYKYCGAIGMVYLHETDPGRHSKARFWLQKGSTEIEVDKGFGFYLSYGPFLFAERKVDTARKIEDYIQKVSHAATMSMDPGMARVFKTATTELHVRALLNKIGSFDDGEVKLEVNLSSAREIERNFDIESKTLPTHLRGLLKLEFAKSYLNIAAAIGSKNDLEDLCTIALDSIDDSWQASLQANDAALTAANRLLWMKAVSMRETKASDRELKELVSGFKKSGNPAGLVKASRSLARFYLNQGTSQKAFEFLSETIKTGIKTPEEGGFYLFSKAFSLITDVMLFETDRPSVSWMVNELDEFFTKITDAIDGIDNWNEVAGQDLFNSFRKDWNRFEPVSHFHVKAYLKYQYYSIKMMRLGAVLQEDEGSVKIADTLLKELSNLNNPLNFIKAEFPDFKDVPNDVRNKVLNKCISISKGDLPMAADHLSFSYRNLRSYITFKEVNRLGFFLDEQQTNQKQLEQGIRLMFHDLYVNGTIFEVVFDMPKFLVAHAVNGFSSQDLEEALDIKGTTAKKYIKIMIDIGIIKHETSMGRKHFYRLRRANVMNRFGNELSNEQKIAAANQ